MSFETLPKVELHLHLEGAMPPAFCRSLAAEKGVQLDGVFDENGGYAYEDFDHFLKVYEAACAPLQSPEDFNRLVRAVCEELAAQNVVYAETFISPDFCGGGDLGAWKEYLHAMTEGAAAMADDIVLKGVVTCVRHSGPEVAKAAAHCAVETLGDFVVGYGMAGAEMMGRPTDFAYSFDMAREAGLHLTCHAGEWGGPDMVEETLDALRPARIGHGINAVRDAALVERLAREGIVLEVCPGSNVFLNAVDSWQAHPIQKLRDAGVPVTVSTDDPPFFHTTMNREYDMLHRTFGWDEADFKAVNATAIAAAFCDDATRARIKTKLEAS